jgi:RNA polymerase sigma factor (sigma-70 family)
MVEFAGEQSVMIKGVVDDLEQTDYELIRICLSGKRDTFSEIVRRYKRLVYATIYNFIGDSHDLNDLFQEVFLRVYKSLASYNPDYQFSTWAVKIATNVCLDRLRQKKAEQLPTEDIEEVVDNRLNPEDHYIAGERLELIRQAVRELPEDYRVPVILFHQQGFSYEALVEITGQPMTVIKNRLHRARLMLKDKLNPDKAKEKPSC